MKKNDIEQWTPVHSDRLWYGILGMPLCRPEGTT